MSSLYYRELHDNISQRAVASYGRALRPFAPVAEGGDTASQQDLHAFFSALYAAMYERPASFGLPITPDDGLHCTGESTARKAEVLRKLKKSNDALALTITLLQEWGRLGRLTDDALVLSEAEHQALLADKTKAKKAILSGMAEVGLVTEAVAGSVALRNARFPQMMPALQALAKASAPEAEPQLAAFDLARCDFRALATGYRPDAPTLLAFAPAADRDRALRLHEYLLSTGYQPHIRIHDVHAWDIKYQGPRKIKGSPLVQFDYSERHQNPLLAQIKCASTDRILPTFPEQPPAVQADFRSRVHRCRGKECGWCKDKKGLGPAVLKYNDEKLTICWYTNPDVAVFDDAAVEVMQGYVQWHQRLA